VKINVISLLKCNTPFYEAIHTRRTGKYGIDESGVREKNRRNR
jgi:hypothetical protein